LSSFEPILLAPEEAIEERYPYRRVWRTSAQEIGVLLFTVLLIVGVSSFTSFLPDTYANPRAKTGLALLPLATWLFFSYRGERQALIPRTGLIGMVILGGLVGYGVAVPLEEHVWKPDLWLPAQGFFGRILGYTFTVGFTSIFLKYLVVRYTVWPQRFNQRLDGIAYILAVAVGYATVFNLHAAWFTDITLAALAMRVASITFSQLSTALLIGYFLSELRISRPPVFWMPMGLLMASFISGLYFAFRSMTLVGSLQVASTGSSPLRSLMLAAGLVIVMFLVMSFLIESADTRMEALTGRRNA